MIVNKNRFLSESEEHRQDCESSISEMFDSLYAMGINVEQMLTQLNENNQKKYEQDMKDVKSGKWLRDIYEELGINNDSFE